MPLPPQKTFGKGPSAILQDARAQEESDRQDRHRSEDISDDCGKVEEEVEALKARYEMYFLGLERREPSRERMELKRRVAKLKGEFVRNTGLRFRIQTLHARFLSYERMWQRSTREKEEGTYRRDVLRARRHLRGEAQEAKTEPAPAKPAPPTAATHPPATQGGIPEERLRALYAEYVTAKQRCNEDTSRFSYESLARSVAKQVPELLAKYKAKSVDFKVEVRDGRAVLKALPRV
ncbi:MAG TPA: MXAN_5187 C-terminal domain-containing protein [Anaeromyxobacteraceae bacterium]